MKRFSKYYIPFAIVTLWGAFSFSYLGVEDGSSGLSFLGHISALFLIPGAFLFRLFKTAATNRDIFLIGFMSWLFYMATALGGTLLISWIYTKLKGPVTTNNTES